MVYIMRQPLIIWGEHGENRKKIDSEGFQDKKFKQEVPQEEKWNPEACQQKKRSGGNLHHAPPKMINGRPLRHFHYI